MNNGVLGCAIFAWHTGYSSFLDASASLGPGVSMIVHCWKDIAVFQDVLKRSQCLRTSLKCLYGKLFFRWPKLGKNAIAFGMISVFKGPTIFFHISSLFHRWAYLTITTCPIAYCWNFIVIFWENFIKSKNFFYPKNLNPGACLQIPKFAFYHPLLTQHTFYSQSKRH